MQDAALAFMLYPIVTRPPASGQPSFVGTWQSGGMSWVFDDTIRATRREPTKYTVEWQARESGQFCSRLWDYYGKPCAGYDCGFACRPYTLTGSTFSWDGVTYSKID